MLTVDGILRQMQTGIEATIPLIRHWFASALPSPFFGHAHPFIWPIMVLYMSTWIEHVTV